MALIIGGILALLCIAVAAYPFVRHRFPGESASSAPEDGDTGSVVDAGLAEDELAEIYRAINTLRLERQLGNIPEGLYREQLNGYRLRAAQVLRIRELVPGRGEDWVLEEEIKVARSGLYRSADGGSPCPNCGRPVGPGNDECAECGAAISSSETGAIPPTDIEEKD